LSTDVSEVRAASVIRAVIMEAASTSETSVENYFSRQYIPEDKSTTYVKFQVLTAASMMFRIGFWNVLPCKIIIDRRFRGTCEGQLLNISASTMTYFQSDSVKFLG
jgi:hypothetical protein